MAAVKVSSALCFTLLINDHGTHLGSNLWEHRGMRRVAERHIPYAGPVQQEDMQRALHRDSGRAPPGGNAAYSLSGPSASAPKNATESSDLSCNGVCPFSAVMSH